MEKFFISAQYSSRTELLDFNLIVRYVIIGYRARELGKQAYERMKKGDFDNTPKKSNIKKEMKNVEGYL